MAPSAIGVELAHIIFGSLWNSSAQILDAILVHYVTFNLISFLTVVTNEHNSYVFSRLL